MGKPELASIDIDGIELEPVDQDEAGPQRPITDLDLPPEYRTQANLWKAKYFESYKELVNANKGLRRLQRNNESLKKRISNIASILRRHFQVAKAEEARADE